ncbi:MAG: hypothetical protein ACRC8K_04955 [Waterburya sp.]
MGDISPEQLKLNQKYVAQYQCEASVASRLQLDIVNLKMFTAETFDIVVLFK